MRVFNLASVPAALAGEHLVISCCPRTWFLASQSVWGQFGAGGTFPMWIALWTTVCEPRVKVPVVDCCVLRGSLFPNRLRFMCRVTSTLGSETQSCIAAFTRCKLRFAVFRAGVSPSWAGVRSHGQTCWQESRQSLSFFFHGNLVLGVSVCCFSRRAGRRWFENVFVWGVQFCRRLCANHW